MPDTSISLPATPERRLTAAQFQQLATVPATAEWLANLPNPNTRRAYQRAVQDFAAFVGIEHPEDFRAVTRAHVLAWRTELVRRGASPATTRHRLAALGSLFSALCDANAVPHHVVQGVRRPPRDSAVGKTPALSDDQVRALLALPDTSTLRGKRDHAILAMLVYHGLRRSELCALRVDDARRPRRGVVHLAIHGKGGKTRFVPRHPAAAAALDAYLRAAGHAADGAAPLFHALPRRPGDTPARGLSPDMVYRLVRAYTTQLDCPVGPHAMRATATTNALDHGADLAQVQAWLGHEDIATTRLYDRRQLRAETSPTFLVAY
ncbi:MAG TPA: tyrosine-type recombinase/integrase [Burkholderiaceae bacterium]